MSVRMGIGVDIHPLVEGRELALGGVIIPHERGLDGHSDGDALIHAIIDACLGAANLGDIGARFPPTRETRGARSAVMLSETAALLRARGWRLDYVDATILAERPILRPHIGDMRGALADALGIDREAVSVKATTADRLGLVGREEGICCIGAVTISEA